MLRRIAISVSCFGVVALVACSSSDGDPAAPPSSPGQAETCAPRTDLDALSPPALHTARWAFEPWISKDISDRADTYAYVDGFRERGIPVGAVVLDSPWETSYNTFVPNPTRYADMPGLIRDMHERNVRVVLWITSLVNETSFDFETGGDSYVGPAPNFDEGQRCNYFVQKGATYTWWKGVGSAVDFFDPNARAWWHRQQDAILEAGIDGWKLDFGESYINASEVATAEGQKSIQAYSERYYEDFLAYGQKVRGRDFVTMVRAWDESYEFSGRFFARREHAPLAWMGDNRRDWFGLSDALEEMFISARAGYPVVGSDIGGYLDKDDKNLFGPDIPFDSLVFARWIAVGALSPFMQLHGRGALAPWSIPDHADETVELYKYWATLHHALVPYLYSLSADAWAGAAPVLRPVDEPQAWRGDYRFLLGDSFLVAPLLDASGKRDVVLPSGSRWTDWWTGTAHEGGTTVSLDYSADRKKTPLFVREGAIVPMTIDSDVLGLGQAAPDATTVLVHLSATPTTFRLREDDDSVTTIDASATLDRAEVKLSTTPKPAVLRVRSETAPATVTVNGANVAVDYDAATRTVLVRVPASAAPTSVVLSTPP